MPRGAVPPASDHRDPQRGPRSDRSGSLWQRALGRLVEPVATDVPPERRRRLRLLMALIVAMIPLGVLISAVWLAVPAAGGAVDDPLTWAGLAIAAALLPSFLLARRDRLVPAAGSAAAVVFVGIVGAVLVAPHTVGHVLLAFLVMPVFVAGLFLSRRTTAAVAAAAVVAAALPLAGPSSATHVAAFLFVVVASVVLALGAHLPRADQEQIEVQAETLQLAQDLADIGHWRWVPSDDRIEISPGLVAIMGLDEGEETLTPEDFMAILPPGDVERISGLLEATGGGESIELDTRLQRSDGTWRDIEFRARVVHDAEGEMDHVLGVTQDITDRRRLEEDLERFFSTSNDMHCVATLDGYFEKLNAAWERVLGWSREELMERPYLDFVHPDDREVTLGAAAQLADGDEVVAFENRYRRRDGGYAWMRWNAVADPERERVYASARDVTQQRERERELRYRTTLLERTVESAQHGIVVLDRQGNVETFNERAAEIWGVEPARLAGMAGEEVLRGTLDRIQEPGAFLDRLRALADDPTSQTRGEVHLFDGRVLEYHAVPVQDHQGEVHGRAWFWLDVTEARRLRQMERREAEERARRQELRHLVDLASHEFSEPLRTVTSFSQLLRDRHGDRLGDDGQEHVGFILDGARRMKDLIRDFVTYAEVNAEPPRTERVDPGAVLQAVRSQLDAIVDASDADVTWDDAMPEVRADPDRLTTVLYHLVKNAVMFSGDGPPRVHVSADDEEAPAPAPEGGDDARPMVVLSVTDDGPGIPVHLHDRVFELFEQLQRPMEHQGTGIGLPLCRRIVEQHGGRLWVESAEGQGATFRLTLPRAGAPGAAAPGAEATVPRPRAEPPSEASVPTVPWATVDEDDPEDDPLGPTGW